MSDKDQFRPVKHAGITYKQRGDGGMLVFYDWASVCIYVTGPSELPWAAEKTNANPRWTRTRGASGLNFGDMRRKVTDYQERVFLAGPNRTLPEPKRVTAYAAFLEHIHPAHLDELADITQRAFNYYSAIRRCPGLFDVACSGRREPGLAGGSALAYALSNVSLLLHRRPSRPLDLVRRLVRRKRREIVVALGFPQEVAGIAVHALERIPRAAINIETIDMLRHLLTHGDKLTRKRIAHCDRISHAFLRVQCDPLLAPSLTSRLIDELLHPPNRVAELADSYWLLEDMARMAYQVGAALPRLHSLAQVNALHRLLINRTNDTNSLPSHGLPPPPVPSLPGQIEYVGTTAGLREEGRAMHNCVGSYAGVVENGTAFVYSVLAPERCTLAIELGADSRFHVREIKAACNAPVRSPATLETVRSWLATHSDYAAVQQVRALKSASRRSAWPGENRDPRLADPDLWDVPF